MGATIVVLDADECQRHNLCQLLREHHCPSESLKTLEELNRRIAENDVLAVIIDIDTVAVDNRTIRDLTLQNPGIYFFCLSEGRFHPELEDAICYHIYACINKPIDPDELFFWIRSIRKEGIHE
jgi:DNA-binding NtrC family response regulator